jgi:RNA polymerase subunit RPABC4/transcription elongation factor Spt4
MAKNRISRKVMGWADFHRSCPKCRTYIPKYRRICPECGIFVKNVQGRVVLIAK